MTVQLVLATSLFGAAVADAAGRAGLLGEPSRRVLVLAETGPVPEIVPPLAQVPGADTVLGRFDAVVDLNGTIAPLHPAAWAVQEQGAPTLQRLLRTAWDLGGGPVELVLPSVHAAPATTLAAVFDDARLWALATGAESLVREPVDIGWKDGVRYLGLAYLEHAPGAPVQLLAQYGVPARPVPIEVVRDALAGIPAPDSLPDGAALALGPAPGAPNEHGQLTAMVRAAADRGHAVVAIKPHPSALPVRADLLHRIGEWAGIELTVLADARPAESFVLATRPALVLGGASGTLLTVRTVAGAPVEPVGAGVHLAALDPYENPARPALVAGTALAGGGRFARPDELVRLLETVGFCRRPSTDEQVRARAGEFVASLTPGERTLFFEERGLSRAGLSGQQS